MKKLEKNPKIVIKKGRCCCKFKNEAASNKIQWFDMFFFPNIVR